MQDHLTESIESAPMPTDATLAKRSSLPYQIIRFVAINVKMIRIIARGH